jgi:hypothetical protein
MLQILTATYKVNNQNQLQNNSRKNVIFLPYSSDTTKNRDPNFWYCILRRLTNVLTSRENVATRLIGISGSLRRASFITASLRAAAQLMPDRSEL